MTIEGRPDIIGSKEFNDKIYQQARRDRLTDMIGDYLGDEDVTPQQFYDDLIKEVDSWVEYHQRNLDRAVEFRTLVDGKNNYEIKVSQFLAEDRITNYSGDVIKIGEDPVILGA